MAENHQPDCFGPTPHALLRFAAIAMMISAAPLLDAQTADPVRYTVTFPAPQTNYASVDAVFPTAGERTVEFFMPVWTPGSYLVREYARNVEDIAVAGDTGNPLTFVKSRKNRWRVETLGAREIHFSYRIYCHEMSVRTNWVEDSFALLNGAPTFITLVGGLKRPHDVLLKLPPRWKTSVTGLAEAPGGAPNHYLAPDYDTLVDSPILAGNPVIHSFEVDGIPHYLVNLGEDGVWDGPRSAADVEKIVRRYRAMWGALPYQKVRLPEPHHRSGRRPRAQQLGLHDDQPLGHLDAPRLPRMARPRVSRVLPRVEHQAAAPGGARPLRLRKREPHQEPLDIGRIHRILRRAYGRARRPFDPPGVSRQWRRKHVQRAFITGTDIRWHRTLARRRWPVHLCAQSF